MIDDVSEQIDVNNEISELLSASLFQQDFSDESELLAELDEMIRYNAPSAEGTMEPLPNAQESPLEISGDRMEHISEMPTNTQELDDGLTQLELWAC